MNRITIGIAAAVLLVLAALAWAVDHYKGKSETAAQLVATMNGTLLACEQTIAQQKSTILEQERNAAVQRASALITDAALLKQRQEQAAREEEYAQREFELEQAKAGNDTCADYLAARVDACVPGLLGQERSTGGAKNTGRDAGEAATPSRVASGAGSGSTGAGQDQR